MAVISQTGSWAPYEKSMNVFWKKVGKNNTDRITATTEAPSDMKDSRRDESFLIFSGNPHCYFRYETGTKKEGCFPFNIGFRFSIYS